ncbi:hypothetical protein DC74_7253 [Streptomyces noursei]|nr:hypothetical protein DC74_7253 [Streptomyces noursei]
MLPGTVGGARRKATRSIPPGVGTGAGLKSLPAQCSSPDCVRRGVRRAEAPAILPWTYRISACPRPDQRRVVSRPRQHPPIRSRTTGARGHVQAHPTSASREHPMRWEDVPVTTVSSLAPRDRLSDAASAPSFRKTDPVLRPPQNKPRPRWPRWKPCRSRPESSRPPCRCWKNGPASARTTPNAQPPGTRQHCYAKRSTIDAMAVRCPRRRHPHTVRGRKPVQLPARNPTGDLPTPRPRHEVGRRSVTLAHNHGGMR